MRPSNEKAIKYGSVVTIDRHSERPGILLSDGFVNTDVYFTKPRRVPNQSLIRGLFIIFPAFANDVKVNIRTFLTPRLLLSRLRFSNRSC